MINHMCLNVVHCPEPVRGEWYTSKQIINNLERSFSSSFLQGFSRRTWPLGLKTLSLVLFAEAMCSSCRFSWRQVTTSWLSLFSLPVQGSFRMSISLLTWRLNSSSKGLNPELSCGTSLYPKSRCWSRWSQSFGCLATRWLLWWPGI